MVEARLVNDQNKTVAAMNAPLVSERYPSSQWMAGEIVRGEHDLPVPATLVPGRYQLQLTVTHQYGRQSGAGLTWACHVEPHGRHVVRQRSDLRIARVKDRQKRSE